MIPKAFNDPKIAERLQTAVGEYNLAETIGFQGLEALSAATELEYIDVHTDAIVAVGDEKIAPATVYVTLRYGLNDPEGPVSLADSYPARVRFTVENDSIVIQGIDVDTSSFYT